MQTDVVAKISMLLMKGEGHSTAILFCLLNKFLLYSLTRYSTHIQWSDETVVYIYHIKRAAVSGHVHEICSKFDFTRAHELEQPLIFPIQLQTCDTIEKIDYVCERPIKATKHSQMQSPEIMHNETFWPDMYSVCPSSHVTHDFLSCDLQSACWAHFASSVIFCESPLLPVPPMFACLDQIERVPYPLVCDHRPDCRDHSDEDFCIFPNCSGVSFQCGTKQVIVMKTATTTTIAY